MASNLRRVKDDIDVLIPLIFYLGANPYWWARSAPELSKELSLDTRRVAEVFKKYPMIFRKSEFDSKRSRHYYSLQMRYSQRDDGKTDEPPKSSALPVLSETEVIGLIDFLFRISSIEQNMSANYRTNLIAVSCAVIAAFAAIFAAFIKTAANASWNSIFVDVPLL